MMGIEEYKIGINKEMIIVNMCDDFILCYKLNHDPNCWRLRLCHIGLMHNESPSLS